MRRVRFHMISMLSVLKIRSMEMWLRLSRRRWRGKPLVKGKGNGSGIIGSEVCSGVCD